MAASGPAVQPCLFLLFPPAGRPDAEAARTAIARMEFGQISHDPSTADAKRGGRADWLELFVDGLTFDLLGLLPGDELQVHKPRRQFGLTGTNLSQCEAVGLAAGPHLAGASNAMPVVRTQLRIAAGLASQWDEVIAVIWQPAGSVMGRSVFVHAVDGWIADGTFPALGLVGVVQLPGGGLASDGLAFFIGQEVHLAPSLCADRVAATRLQLRLVDRLVETGPLLAANQVPLADGSHLRLSAADGVIRVEPG